MAKIQSGEVLDIITLSKLDAEIGDYQWSHLTEIQFNDEKLGTWFLCDGRSAEGTAFEEKTGADKVPDMKTNGAFLRQASGTRVMGTYEADQMQGHWHSDAGHAHSATASENNGLTPSQTIRGGNGKTFGWSVGSSGANIRSPSTDGTNGTPRTGNETRPKNVALNLFVKVNY